MDEIRALDRDKRFFNMDYNQAENFVLNRKIDD